MPEPRYIRVLKLERHSEVWYVGPCREAFQHAADHAYAVQLGLRLASTLEVDMREETLEQVNAQRKQSSAVSKQRAALVLFAAAYFACATALQVKTAQALRDLRAEVAALKSDTTHVTHEQMRAWVEEVNFYNNNRVPQPQAGENR